MPPLTSRLPARVLASASVLVTLLVGAPALAASGDPVPPVTQPASSEGYAPYVGQSSCDPIARTGVKLFRDRVLAAYARGRDGGIVRECAIGGTSEHKEGRAWDWMLNASDPSDRAAADRFHAWLFAPGPDGRPGEMARRTGVMYSIWDGKIWSASRSSEGWRAYTGPNPHTDHIHLSFSWEGALGLTSFWDGTVAAPDYGPCRLYTGQPAPLRTGANPSRCPAPSASPVSVYRSIAWIGSKGPEVADAQRRLGITADGSFGMTTRSRVLTYQGEQKIPRTGAMDALTWSRLDPSSVLPPSLTVAVSAPATAYGKVAVSSSVSGTNGGRASKVVFRLDGVAVATDTTAPYSFEWDTTRVKDGLHRLDAVATEAATGKAFTSPARSVTVRNYPWGSSVVRPALSRRLYVNVAAHAAPPATVNRVEVLVDGRLRFVDRTAPYTGTFFSPRGVRSVSVRLVDSAGRVTALPPKVVRVR